MNAPFRRTHPSAAAFVGMASLLPFHGARAAATMNPDTTAITCVAESHDFTLADLRGRFVLVHYLPGTGDHEARVREVVDGSRSLAGVHNLFIRTDSTAAAAALASKFDARGAEVAFDEGGRLARELKVDPAAHTVIARDESGAELFRVTGGEAADFKAVRSRLLAATRTTAREHYNLPKDSTVALQGYDPVAYFEAGKAEKGDEKITAEYRGVTYRFATTARRSAFVASPRKYLPTYGGWCASAMGDGGRKVGIDPTNFKVKDGRLFVFYKSIFADALKDWNKNEKQWEPAADGHWKKITGE